MEAWDPERDVVLTDSEDEEDIAMKRDFNGRDAILFVVDANLAAVAADEENNASKRARLMEALNIIRSAFISGMLVKDKDLMGLVFANTEHQPLPQEASCLDNIVLPANCAVFLPLRQLTKPIVEHYLEFLDTADTHFAGDYGLAEPDGRGNFANMIRLCIDLLEKCGKKLNNAKIVYMTDVQEPVDPSSNEFQAAVQKAKDLEGKEFEFHVIPMVDNFDYEPFYKEFISLSRDIEPDAFQVPDAKQLRELLEDRKLKQDFLRRCLGHFSLSLGPDLNISVQYYNYFLRRNYPKKVKILRRDNSLVQTKRSIMVRKKDAESNEVTHEYQIKMTGGWHEIKLGDMSLRITTEQFNGVRNMHPPGMMLLGFKHRSSLSGMLYSKPSNFMYPDDQKIIGSRRLFRALWQRCLEREKIAICLFMSKRKSTPRYVALVPVEADDTESEQSYRSRISGDGFKIVYLPTEKQIRQIDWTEWNNVANTATEEGIDLFQKIIKRLRVNEYQPYCYRDPHMDELQNNLMALALNIKSETETNVTDTKVQDERLSKFWDDYDSIFGPEEAPAKKRTAKSTAEGASAPKLARVDDANIKDYDFVQQLIKDDKLIGCTANQLRTILKEHFQVKMPASANKSVLVERIVALMND
ncbi:ATP-dependent DNA helicase 2 subunit 1 [Scaptodrosophila lebanonensis]|uniref:ATP-dependent DNA helicase 2 subunit 1 n=1 Tax=Drosophila lebanonensis TaxID=7225 RepID=A0A6J2TFA1_DROLE|nr:ATP-dependent DNA helicase 2 subunit 1 [Scaptodrosophila lebanonensis]